jgi:ERCC4-type nuclease
MTATQPRPVLIIDSREQCALPLEFPFIVGTLQSGDYSIRGCENLFAVERKSVADLVSCTVGEARERFTRELHRLRGFAFKRLLLIGVPAEVTQHRYRSSVSPQSVMGSLAAWEIRFDCPVVWCPDPESAARLVESWASYFSREILKTADCLRSAQEAGQAREIAV